MPSDTPVARVERTYCRICEAACGLKVELDDRRRPLRILPDKEHPVSRGYVCAKGTRFLEVANHPERLRYPQRRTADGRFERIGWNEALATAAARLRPILAQHGPHAVGVYYGNPLLFNALGLVGVLAFTRALGTRNIYSSFSQDCNNKFMAAQLMHGGPLVQPIPDVAHADFALMLGTNPAVSQGSFVHLDGGASAFDRYVARGGEVVWVDPRRTESVRRWGEHLPIRPGTDVYLLLALLHALRDLYRPGPHEAGLAQLLALAQAYPAERTAVLTAVPAGAINDLAARIRAARRCTFHMSVGVNMGPFGTLAAVALQALAYLTGNFDREGGLLFHPLGPMLSGLLARLGIGTDPAPSRIGGFTGVFDELPGGILADEILTPGAGQIRALIVVGGNPLTSIPGEPRLRAALGSLETLICVDLFANETGRMADLLLPATSWLERFDVASTTGVFQTGVLLQYGRGVAQPPGEARAERRIVADLALALERPLFNSRRLTRVVGDWPLDGLLGGGLDVVTAPYRAFQNGARGLPTPAPRAGRFLRGKRVVRFWRPELDAEVQRLAQFAAQLDTQDAPTVTGNGNRHWPGERHFVLVSRRRRLGHNSWLHGARHDGDTEAAAWFAPPDFAALGLQDGARVRLEQGEAAVEIAAVARDEVSPGVVVVPHGVPGANVNALIPSGPAHVEPLSGNHHMTGIGVRVRPLGQIAAASAVGREVDV